MKSQVFVVVTYRDGHHHVTPLYPRVMGAEGVQCVARELAETEGRACKHATDGDRIKFAAVRSDSTASAVQLTERGAVIAHGEFTL